MASHLAGQHERLWVPVASPVIWAVHFMLCYITAAMLCGRFAVPNAPTGLRALIGVYTAVAITGIVLLFVHGLRRHRYQLPTRAHDDDTPEDRRHFIAWTTMLLAGLSLFATAFVALAVVIVDRCA